MFRLFLTNEKHGETITPDDTSKSGPGWMPTLSALGKPLLIGLAIREILAPFTGHPFDFEIWVRLGAFIQSGTSPYSLLPFVPNLSFAPYPVMTSISYPPFPAMVFGATYALYQLLGSPSAFLYYFLLKQPMVFSDLLVAVLLFKMISLRGEASVAKRVATLWIFFPFAIIVSAMWGALDPTALVLVLASVYTFETGRSYVSAGFLGLAIYFKLMPIIFLPLFLIACALSKRNKAGFTGVALGIPFIGTAVPFLLFGWSPSGLFSAVSYQGSLPGFGGLGVFNVLSMLQLPSGALTFLLSIIWVPALLVAYAYSYLKKAGLIEGLLITVLLFSVFRPVTPEQWALYPVAFLLLLGVGENRTHALAIAGIATAYLLVNNVLLVRFFSPISPGAFNWDLFVDNQSGFSVVRYALLLALSTFFTAEALSAALSKRSFFMSKLSGLRQIRPRGLVVPLAYICVVSATGGFLDFTATKMVTDWGLAIESNVFLGLSWLSLYHIMLVVVFEAMTLFIVLFSRRGLSDSIGLFLLLTFLNFIAAAFSLLLYRGLEGAPLLATTTIFLVGSSSVTERAFVIFADTLGLLGIFYLSEIRSLFYLVGEKIAQISPGSWPGTNNANSLSAAA